MNMHKKKRNDWKKMKRKANSKLKRKAKYLHEQSTLVEKSNTNNGYWEKEIDYLSLELKYLKDTYEIKKKLYENCFMFKEQVQVELRELEKESKETLLSGNSFLRRDKDDVELKSPRAVKEEYVEYEENDTVKSEPIDQSKIKSEPIVAFMKSE